MAEDRRVPAERGEGLKIIRTPGVWGGGAVGKVKRVHEHLSVVAVSNEKEESQKARPEAETKSSGIEDLNEGAEERIKAQRVCWGQAVKQGEEKERDRPTGGKRKSCFQGSRLRVSITSFCSGGRTT